MLRNNRVSTGYIGYALLSLLLLTSCSDATNSPPTGQASGLAIRGAVAYQRGQDVFVKDFGGRPRLVAKNASFPRWSPDGDSLVVVNGNKIIEVDVKSKARKTLATASDPRAVAWSSSGDRVFFTDGRRVRVVDRHSLKTRVVARGHTFRELDIDPTGRRLVSTVRGSGISIRLFDLETGESERLAKGCSASFSPDGTLVSNLVSGHRQLVLLSSANGKRARILNAPKGIKYDNHFWTNHPDWIAGELEGRETDIVLINAIDGSVHRITQVGDASRADIFISE